MRFLALLFGALLFVSEVGSAATRLKTDEVTSKDDMAVSFPGGIVVPTSQLEAVSGNNGFQSSSTYSAVVTPAVNLDSATTPATLKYELFGKLVHVWGQVTLNPTSGSATLTTFYLTLPKIPDGLTGTSKAAGSAGLPTTIANGVCNALTNTSKVACTYGAVSTSADVVNVSFWYATNN
jgi:hypothetical protein